MLARMIEGKGTRDRGRLARLRNPPLLPRFLDLRRGALVELPFLPHCHLMSARFGKVRSRGSLEFSG